MKHLLAIAFAVLLPVAALAADSNQEEQHQATEAAKAWLALVDAGNYDQAWTDAAKHLRQTKKVDWIASTKAMREALGAATFRHPGGVVITKSIAGLSSGDYALVFFSTVFEKNAEGTEKVTMVREGGAWKTVAYTAK
jgi:hypothetical protein